jgi:hypothetical protein
MRSKYIEGCERFFLIPGRFNLMNKSATSVLVSKGKKEKRLTLYIQSNIYLVRLHRYKESHISQMQIEEE